MTAKPAIRAFFDEATNTVSYLIVDPATKRAAVVDKMAAAYILQGALDRLLRLAVPEEDEEDDYE